MRKGLMGGLMGNRVQDLERDLSAGAERSLERLVSFGPGTSLCDCRVTPLLPEALPG